MDLIQMMIFAKVAELQNFTKAARELGIEKSNVSVKVSRLEERLGVRLLNRTTRSVTLTEAGEGYYQFCADILKRAEEADAYAESLNSEPRGTLRITAAAEAGPTMVKTMIKPFIERYPQISVDLFLTNRKIDLVRERFDLAIRAGSLAQKEAGYIVRQIARSSSGLYASPEFIKQHGMPGSVEDLEQLDIVGFASDEGFEDKVSIKAVVGKRKVRLAPGYRIKVNDMATCLESALQGLGVAIIPTDFIRKHIENGSLLQVLPELVFPEAGLYALYPSRHLKSAKLNVFLDYLLTWEPEI